MILLLHLALWSSLAWPHDNLDNSWKQALESKRSEHLESWITSASNQGVRSPEAHYNLGLAYWNEGKKGAAIHQLLQSTKLRSSPNKIWRVLETLSAYEREIGVREGLSASVGFALYYFLNDDVLLILGTLTIWLLAAFFILRTFQPKGYHATKEALVIGHLCLLTLTLTSFGYRYFSGEYAVLLNAEDGIALFRKAKDDESKKLAELPSGTIVRVSQTEGGFTRITHPVAGWVPQTHVKAF